MKVNVAKCESFKEKKVKIYRKNSEFVFWNFLLLLHFSTQCILNLRLQKKYSQMYKLIFTQILIRILRDANLYFKFYSYSLFFATYNHYLQVLICSLQTHNDFSRAGLAFSSKTFLLLQLLQKQRNLTFLNYCICFTFYIASGICFGIEGQWLW